MLLKGTMRERQAPKRWCLAEERHGDSPEACIALRETLDPDIPCLRCQPAEPKPLTSNEEY